MLNIVKVIVFVFVIFILFVVKYFLSIESIMFVVGFLMGVKVLERVESNFV